MLENIIRMKFNFTCFGFTKNLHFLIQQKQKIIYTLLSINKKIKKSILTMRGKAYEQIIWSETH